MNNFTISFSNNLSNLGSIAKFRAKAEYMFLTPKVSSVAGVTTLTVDCDTTEELRILKAMEKTTVRF